MSESSFEFSEAPISRLVGFDVEPGPPGEATVGIQCDRRHHNPMARVHGGLIAALADAAMGIAFGRTLVDDQDFSTIEMKINFIRPVREGRILAKAKVVERGLRIGFVDCEITNDRGKRIATATSTCTVISK
ncbi:PaaI family thioesterase [Rubripirellula amarantea]|uniref:Putative esterase n=1 Tax=Rubripirellula amarantea TaxID=2527999 RepID=A0A5C5WXT7_9BACT|nr:PaaI family thioesterase [Rubripirellula amarantea]MDA8743789.1 PaaI family thioesterase [Rubripirellula amarantea]TWT54705.1 putative esterase [Rubripirellula amarantea]